MNIKSVTNIQDLVPVQHAFISLANKQQSGQLASQLFDICPDLTIFSSGGTYAHLKKELAGTYKADRLIEVSSYTGMPETDGGLVKTLHHKLFLGYLTETFSEAHQADLKRENAVPIDLIIVDMYPFNEVRSKVGSTIEECRSNIDVGGPSALRAGAKNYLRVMTVAKYNPEAYEALIAQINQNRGCTDISMRRKGASETFKVLANYDAEIAEFFSLIPYAELKETYKFKE